MWVGICFDLVNVNGINQMHGGRLYDQSRATRGHVGRSEAPRNALPQPQVPGDQPPRGSYHPTYDQISVVHGSDHCPGEARRATLQEARGLLPTAPLLPDRALSLLDEL